MRFFTYLRDIRGELRHVSWPTKNQTIAFTAIVVVISILTGVYLGFSDFIFNTLLQKFVI